MSKLKYQNLTLVFWILKFRPEGGLVHRELVNQAEPRMQKTLNHLADELKAIRTGRASTALVEDVPVTYYEQQMTIKQLANIATPDAKSIAISPWDPGALEPIERALREAKELDLNPISDGKVIHINVPPLTQERRQQLVKQINEKVEQAHISLRNIRHEILNEVKQLQKDKRISDDDYHWAEQQLTRRLDEFRNHIDATAEHKRQDILAV